MRRMTRIKLIRQIEKEIQSAKRANEEGAITESINLIVSELDDLSLVQLMADMGTDLLLMKGSFPEKTLRDNIKYLVGLELTDYFNYVIG